MLYKIRFRPAFATLFVTLNPDESIVTAVDTLISMDAGIKMKTKFAGNLISALLGKLLGKHSLLVNVYQNQHDEPRSLILSQPMLGDVERVDLKRGGICVQPGAYLAHTSDVNMGLAWGGLGSWLRGEGLFKLKFTGKGRVFISAYGGITKRVLYTEFAVESGHLLAYEPSIRLKPHSVTKGGMGCLLRGKGLFYLQSRNLERLSEYLTQKL
ncbi:MAG: TIGR00266 family protein [Microcystaceae cyanobacterium]